MAAAGQHGAAESAAPPRQLDGLAVALVIAASALTTYVAVRSLWPDYLNTVQLDRHLDVLESRAGDPWQYRVLSEYAIGALRELLELAGLGSASTAFIITRFVQGIAIFGLSFAYTRSIGIERKGALFGIVLLAWSVTQTNELTDLSFSTYTDVAFFLLAAILILRERPNLAVALTPIAVLNRETALLIPLLFVAFAPSWKDRGAWRHAALAGLLGIATYAAIRLTFGSRPVILASGHALGFDLLEFNLTRQEPLLNVLLTVGLLPLLAAAGWRYADLRLRRLCILVVPAWVAVHLFLSSIQETRLLLVPIALVLVPLAVASLDGRRPSTITS